MPDQARIAVQFVLNYRKEGGENCILHGDTHSGDSLRDCRGLKPFPRGIWSMESSNELRLPARGLADSQGVRKSGELAVGRVRRGDGAGSRRSEVAMALQVNGGRDCLPRLAAVIHYQDVPERVSVRCCNAPSRYSRPCTAKKAAVWYTGAHSPRTPPGCADEGAFVYDTTNYGDDLHFWIRRRTPGRVCNHFWWCPYTWHQRTWRALRRAGLPPRRITFFQLPGKMPSMCLFMKRTARTQRCSRRSALPAFDWPPGGASVAFATFSGITFEAHDRVLGSHAVSTLPVIGRTSSCLRGGGKTSVRGHHGPASERT